MRGRAGPVGKLQGKPSRSWKVWLALVPLLFWAAAMYAHQDYFQRLHPRTTVAHVLAEEHGASAAEEEPEPEPEPAAVTRAMPTKKPETVAVAATAVLNKRTDDAVPTKGAAAAVSTKGAAAAVSTTVNEPEEVEVPTPKPVLHAEKQVQVDTAVPKPEKVASGALDADGCPAGRKPFLVILTSEGGSPGQPRGMLTFGGGGVVGGMARHADSVYQNWQTRILHYHFMKQKKANPCTEMAGIMRVLSSAGGKTDDLMDLMPTFVASSTTNEVHRGFHVINRPWSMLQFVNSPRFNEMVKTEYVYIMETDHLLMQDLPNHATPDTVVGFYFPYMETKADHLGKVAARFYDKGPVSDIYPTGPSPTILHTGILKRVAQSWFDMSVKLKHDPEADRVFGWALEMWGWTIACAHLGIKHLIEQKLQIEPSATWHQNVTVEDPYIFHYTFGHEYDIAGIPMVGIVGEWSLDKRRWTNVYPPLKLTPPPKCAGEATHVLTALLNEAMTANEAVWKARSRWGSDTLMGQSPSGLAQTATDASGESAATTQIVEVMTQLGAWSIGSLTPVYFYKNFKLHTPKGSGTWSITDANHMKLSVKLCGAVLPLEFEGDPRLCLEAADDEARHAEACKAAAKFKLSGYRGTRVLRGELVEAAPAWSDPGDTASPTVKRLAGSGPWAWQGVTPVAFFRGGVLQTPWGPGKWGPLAASGSGAGGSGGGPHLFMNFVGAEHDITLGECHSFQSKRRGDGNEVAGWMQIPIHATSRCFDD